jgi:hypothetical protein
MALKRKYDVYTKYGKKLTGEDLNKYMAAKEQYSSMVNNASEALNTFIGDFCKSHNLVIEMGLAPDECVRTEEYKQLNMAYNSAWANYRNFNSMFKIKPTGWA